MANPRVTVAYVHPNEIAASFHACLIGMLMWDAAHHAFLLHDNGQLAVRCGTDGLVQARNQAAAAFVKSESEWLLWIDSDMGFPPDALDALMNVAHPTERPMVGGLCFASREYATDGMGGHRASPKPTIYQYREVDGLMRFAAADWYPVNQLVAASATGSAFLLIHRSVFEKMHANYGTFYDRTPGTDGNLLGEDISFCARAGALGFPLVIHTGVRTTHLKPQWVQEEDFWKAFVPPPATEPVAVVVPVLKRPQNAQPFMQSLRASTGLAIAYAVTDEADTATREAWATAGGTVLTSTRGSRFAQKANHGYLNTTEPWIFLVGDDVRFHPGWLDHALHTATLAQADVIATNDLGNPAVLAGRHATHPLIRRSYVDEQGASWDGPGLIATEAYAHNYVDNEWTMVAQQRGVFASALGARVEHLHPFWAKGSEDEVYKKGAWYRDRDRKIFEKRVREHAA